MGYLSTVYFDPYLSKKEAAFINSTLDYTLFVDDYDREELYSIKWYTDYDDAFRKLSLKFPTKVYTLTIDGEDPSDYSVIAYKNGKEFISQVKMPTKQDVLLLIEEYENKSKNKYVVLENFNENICLCTNTEGEVQIFHSLKEAEEVAKECQNGKVIKL